MRGHMGAHTKNISPAPSHVDTCTHQPLRRLNANRQNEGHAVRLCETRPHTHTHSHTHTHTHTHTQKHTHTQPVNLNCRSSRSEERHVGKACRSRVSPSHSQTTSL